MNLRKVYPVIILLMANLRWKVFAFTPLTTHLPVLKEDELGSEDEIRVVTTTDSDIRNLRTQGLTYSVIKSVESEGSFGMGYDGSVDNTTKFVWRFSYGKERRGGELGERGPQRQFLFLKIFAEVNENVGRMFPVEFEVKHFHRTVQWTLPDKVASGMQRSSNKSLCFPKIEDEIDTDVLDRVSLENKAFLMTISTTSWVKRAFKFKVDLEQADFINFDDERKVEIYPSSPAYFRIGAPSAFTARYALLYVYSDDDDGCVTVTLQSPVCPFGETDMKFQGTHQTMNRMAAITIKMDELKQGRFLSLNLHENSSECDYLNENLRGYLSPTTLTLHDNRSAQNKGFKTVHFVLKEKIDDEVYLLATLGIFVFLSTFCVLFGVLFWKVFRLAPLLEDIKGHGSPTPSSETSVSTQSDADIHHCCFIFLIPEAKASNSHLQESCRKCSRDISKSAQRYVGTFSVVAAFYILPVFQFVHFYQLVINKPGNEDLCYYNYLCLHPLGHWKDFNHIFSNVAYVMLGFLFLTVVFMEDVARRFNKSDDCHETGIHEHFGIPYAMGAALVMEGVLSAMYHVCPNHLSFQFDMSFMYVIAVLCLVKIYQARHPDTNASACLAFGSLAIMIVLGVAATFVQASYLWMMTTIIHLSVVFFISLHVYSWGNWRFDWILFRNWEELKSRLFSLFSPLLNLNWMIIFLILANLINWLIAALGSILFFKFSDVSSHLLFVVLINLGIYSVIYGVYKVKNGERILWPTKMYVIAAAPVWAAGVFAFSSWSANWQLSPAESRKLNTECSVMMFYDMHDIWHFLSAFGIFFMFMFFFTIDDNLKLVKRTDIRVF